MLKFGVRQVKQKARSQGLNRFLARRELVRKIKNDVLGRKSEEEMRRERIRRAKRRRSRRAKNRMLEQKKLQAQKKELRTKPQLDKEIGTKLASWDNERENMNAPQKR